jgi:GxxExxY protein
MKNEDNYKHSEISDKIIKAYYNVYNKLGYGFLEKVYEHAMLIELRKAGINVVNQFMIKVFYDGTEVGNYLSDLFVESGVFVEVKAAEGLAEEHQAQLINYFKATNIEVGLLLNFGKKPSFKRKVFSNNFKTLI